MNKPKIGQMMYLSHTNSAIMRDRTTEKLILAIVSKVGRKYFYVDCEPNGRRGIKFHIDSWEQFSDGIGWGTDYKIYADPLAYRDDVERCEIYTWLYKQFDHGKLKANISLKNLRKIKALMEGKND